MGVGPTFLYFFAGEKIGAWLNTGMPRQFRIEYEGALYHLLSRGDRREDIFWEEKDRRSR